MRLTFPGCKQLSEIIKPSHFLFSSFSQSLMNSYYHSICSKHHQHPNKHSDNTHEATNNYDSISTLLQLFTFLIQRFYGSAFADKLYKEISRLKQKNEQPFTFYQTFVLKINCYNRVETVCKTHDPQAVLLEPIGPARAYRMVASNLNAVTQPINKIRTINWNQPINDLVPEAVIINIDVKDSNHVIIDMFLL